MIQIHAFLPEAQCEYSRKTGEAVEISATDGSIRKAIVSMPELAKMLRFRYAQQQKQATKSGESQPPPKT